MTLLPLAAWLAGGALACLLVGVLSAVILPGHDCGEVGCSQRGNPWHSHSGGER